jgi:carbonic anhydrase
MGHTQCGAVKAAFSTLDGKDAGSENLNKLVADIHPRISRYKGRAASTDYTEESWANVQGVISDLQKRSKILSEKTHENKIKISGALYHLDSGYVDFK